MSISISKDERYILANIPMGSSLEELDKWRKFLHRVLKHFLQGKKIYLFTLSPQTYSLGYELGSFQESKVGDEKVLINFLEKITDNTINEIVNSEEFTRGLLKLSPVDTIKSFDDLTFLTDNAAILKEELITIEDDGTSFYWYNPGLSKDQIQEELIQINLLEV